MSTSDRKISANRLNGRKSHGPMNTTSSRYDATKHGLLSCGVTELDDADGYRTTLRELLDAKNPVGPIEAFLVESLALDVVRCRRARQLEAEYITGVLNPPTFGSESLGGDFELALKAPVIDRGLPATVDSESAQKLVTFQRYESSHYDCFGRSTSLRDYSGRGVASDCSLLQLWM